jgi:hypothetical protein
MKQTKNKQTGISNLAQVPGYFMTQADFDRLLEVYGKEMSIIEFIFKCNINEQQDTEIDR